MGASGYGVGMPGVKKCGSEEEEEVKVVKGGAE